MATFEKVQHDPFAIDGNLEKVNFDPFAQAEQSIVNDGIDSILSPEERGAVDSVLSPEQKQDETVRGLYELRDGIPYSDQMVSERNKLRAGEHATSGLILDQDKKANAYNDYKRTDILKAAGDAFIKAAGATSRYVTQSFLDYFHGPELKYYPTAAAQNEVARLEEAGLNAEFSPIARKAGKRIGEAISSISPEEWEAGHQRALEQVGEEKTGWFEKGVIMLADSAPMMVSSAMNPSAGYLTSFSIMSDQLEQELETVGIDPDLSETTSATYGMIAGAVEYIENFSRIGSAFGKSAGNPVAKVIINKLKTAGINVGEEVLQEFLSNVAYNAAVTKHNEKNGDEIPLKGLTDEFGNAVEGSLAMTLVLESLGLSVKGIKKATEMKPLNVGDLNEQRAVATDEELIATIDADPVAQEDPIYKEKLTDAKLSPSEDTANAFNQYVWVEKPNAIIEMLDPEAEPSGEVESEQVIPEQTAQEIADAGSVADISEKGRKVLGLAEKAKSGIEKTMRVSTRMKRIAPEVALKFRETESISGRIANSFIDKAKPFTDSYKSAVKGMSKEQKSDLNSAISNLDLEAMERAGLKNIDELRTVFDEVADRSDIKKIIENYFPRQVKDYDGLVRYFAKEPSGPFTQAINAKQKEVGRELTSEEKEQAVRGALSGGNGGKSFQKQRTIEEVTPDIEQFYESPIDALMRFINQGSELIARKEILGIEGEMSDEMGNEAITSTEDNVAGIISDLVGENKLDKTQESELRELMKSRLEMKGTPKGIRMYAKGVYLKYVTNLKTALKQFGDIGVSVAENGFSNVVSAGEESNKYKEQFVSSAKTFMEEIGVNQLDAEMQQQMRGNIEEILFKPLSLADVFNKELLAKSTISKWSKMADSDPDGLIQVLDDKFEVREFSEKVASDLKEGKWTPDVATALYSQMSDFHPVSHLEHVKLYMDSPQSRILFVLKSFALTRWDRLYRESTAKYIDGISMAIAGADSDNQAMVAEGGRMVAEGTKGLGRFLIGAVAIEIAIERAYNVAMEQLGFRPEPEDEEQEFDRSFFGLYTRELAGLFPFLDGFSAQEFMEDKNVEKLVESVWSTPMPIGVDSVSSVIEAMTTEKEISEIDKWKRDIPYIGSEWYKKSKAER